MFTIDEPPHHGVGEHLCLADRSLCRPELRCIHIDRGNSFDCDPDPANEAGTFAPCHLASKGLRSARIDLAQLHGKADYVTKIVLLVRVCDNEHRARGSLRIPERMGDAGRNEQGDWIALVKPAL